MVSRLDWRNSKKRHRPKSVAPKKNPDLEICKYCGRMRVTITIRKKKMVKSALLVCHNCKKSFRMQLNELENEHDVYSAWADEYHKELEQK